MFLLFSSATYKNKYPKNRKVLLILMSVQYLLLHPQLPGICSTTSLHRPCHSRYGGWSLQRKISYKTTHVFLVYKATISAHLRKYKNEICSIGLEYILYSLIYRLLYSFISSIFGFLCSIPTEPPGLAYLHKYKSLVTRLLAKKMELPGNDSDEATPEKVNAHF